MNIANREQIAWIGWLLHDEEGKGFLKLFVESDVNIERIKHVWASEPYNEETQSMLNYILGVYHKNEYLIERYKSWFVSQPF